MNLDLKENRTHGSTEYPYAQYHMKGYKRPFQIPVHWHDEFELIFIKKGKLYVQIGEKEFNCKEGDLLFVNPRELHLMDARELGSSFYTLLFPVEFISFQTLDHLENDLMSHLRNHTLVLPSRLEDDRVRLQLIPLIDQLTRVNVSGSSICEAPSPEKDLETRIILLSLYRILLENNLIQKTSSDINSQLPRQIVAYINENYQGKLSLKEMADEFHMSEKYLSRYFVEHFHLPFSSYLMHLRLTHARQLLESTDLSVTDVAFQSGFPNVSYFIRSFKASYKLSPLQYRKKIVS